MAGSRWLFWSCGLITLLALILFGRTSPLASVVLGIWLPLPILLVGWRLGTGKAALLALVGALFVVALTPGLAAWQDDAGLWAILLMGLLLVIWRSRGWPEGSGIMVTVAFLGLLSLGFFLGQAYFQGLTPAQLWQGRSQELGNALTAMLADAGVSISDLKLMGLPRVELQDLLIQVLPALVLINYALTAWINVLVGRKLAQAWGWADQGEPLSLWASPEWLVFFLVAAGFSLLVPVAWVRQTGLNLILILGFMYFCQGIAVIAALLQRYQLPLVLRGVVYFLAFMNPLMIVVMILGLTDLWLDFRMLQPPREP